MMADDVDHSLPPKRIGGREVTVTQSRDGGVTVTIATRRNAGFFIAALSAVPEPSGVGSDHPLLEVLIVPVLSVLWALLIAPPVGWLFFRLFATARPRATVRLSPETLQIGETADDSLGTLRAVQTRRWPADAVDRVAVHPGTRGLTVFLRRGVAPPLLRGLSMEVSRLVVVELQAGLSRIRGKPVRAT